MFYTFNKIILLGLYAAALASFAITLPIEPDMVRWLRIIAGGLLAAHALEVVVFSSKVRLYEGPMAVSVLLTLLFGFLHWKPLADAARR